VTELFQIEIKHPEKGWGHLNITEDVDDTDTTATAMPREVALSVIEEVRLNLGEGYRFRLKPAAPPLA